MRAASAVAARQRVVVVEPRRAPNDDTLARHLAADRFDVCAAETLDDALPRLAGRAADVVVLEVSHICGEPGALVQEVRAKLSGARTLVVGRSCCNRCSLDALRAGADGYLCRSEAAERLAIALDELKSGGVPMSPLIAQYVLAEVRRQSGPGPALGPSVALTVRETEVVELLASGARYEDVGTALHVSVNTVRTHVRSIYEKLEVGSRTEAVLAAIERGLVRPR